MTWPWLLVWWPPIGSLNQLRSQKTAQHSDSLLGIPNPSTMRVQNPYFSHMSLFPPETPIHWNTHMRREFHHWKSKAESDWLKQRQIPPWAHSVSNQPVSLPLRAQWSIGEKAVQVTGLCCSRTRTGPRFSHMTIMVCGKQGPQTTAETLWLQNKE